MNQPESAVIWATVENSSHPEYGVVTIPFPVPRDAYDTYIEQLQKMELGDPLKQDCRVVSVVSDYSVLKQLEVIDRKYHVSNGGRSDPPAQWWHDLGGNPEQTRRIGYRTIPQS